MDKSKKFSIKDRIRAFVYAWRGLKALVRNEHNARIHVGAAICAVALGFVFNIEPLEWVAVVLCIGAVIAAEALNSGIEALADKLCREQDPLIGLAKDYGAAAVTLLAVASAIVGLIIFIPYFISLL